MGVTPPMICGWCDEPLDEGPGDLPFMHHECITRAIIGSIAHQQGRCSCFVEEGADDIEDPPGLTRRQAAKEAYEYYGKHRSEDP